MSKEVIDDVISSYLKQGKDFGFSTGFSAVDELPLNEQIKTKDQALQKSVETIDTVKARLKITEELIMPLLVNLLETSDRAYIHWPGRKKTIKDMMEKILQQTRVS